MRAFAVPLIVALLILAATISSAQPTPNPPSMSNPVPVESAPPANSVSIGYEYEHFNIDFDPWHLVTLELSHKFGFGSVIGRINEAKRFGERSTQVEIDSYPQLGTGTYAYLNVGYSRNSFFPDWRFGAEIFQNLPHAYEFSIGARRLEFTSTKINLYTGSLGKYWGNNWISLRPYVSHDETGTSWSGGLQFRHYFASSDDYVGVSGSFGKAPEENVVLQEIARQQSFSFRLFAKRKFDAIVLTGGTGYRDLEVRQGDHRKSWVVNVGIELRF
jgi:YaiO family outer membrane protein